MISQRLISELKAILQVQNKILRQLEQALSEVEGKLSDVSQQAEQIAELEQLMAEIESSIDWLEEEDLNDFDPDDIIQLYERRQASVAQDLVKIGFKDWNSFVRQCQTYCLQQGLDPLAPYDAMLTAKDRQKLKDESYNAQFKWDEWDYIFVGASGVLAALTDFLLLGIPTKINSGQYAGKLGSPLTAWFKQYNIKDSNDWFAQLAKQLEKNCETPYDRFALKGMGGKTHRFQSLGHDPVLGFVFGILDIMRGTITGFSYDDETGNHSFKNVVVRPDYEPVGLIEAFLKHLGHLISDVATPQGLPVPFMSLFQGLNINSFCKEDRTIGETARRMYLDGYDFRHFFVSGITTPGVIEMILRAYIMLRNYFEGKEINFFMADHPKYRSMLLAAHSIATLGNAGKIALMQGNPLAINSAQWVALLSYLMPSVKYWVFDQHKLRLEHHNKINEEGWNSLLTNSDALLEVVYKSESPLIQLGTI